MMMIITIIFIIPGFFHRFWPNDKKKNLNAKAALTTFMVSAVWHGFYPGFYLFFSGAFLLDTQAKLSG